ncbi:unnamed protein product [Anisakis simplex]|uniref:Transmembrane protein n=1 Tax=Anisakis simplex TaxID=6269 RepID=A0A0M3KAN2_ANISI|nr:unnamed protein product [Anisakis simplex]
MDVVTDRTPFRHYLPEYRCCCGSMHVKQGTLVIAVLYSILIAFIFISKLLGSSEPLSQEIIEIIVLILELVALALVFKALCSENELLLIPFLLFQLIGLLVSGIGVILMVIALIDADSFAGRMVHDQVVMSSENAEDKLAAFGSEKSESLLVQVTAAFALGTLFVSIAITMWWMWVVKRCFNYFRDLNRERAKRNISMSFKATTIVP